MEDVLPRSPGTNEEDHRIAEIFRQEQSRLRNFIRRRVADDADIEDILQDVFSELVEAYRLMQPIEQVGAWLFRVARNRIIDRFRKKQPERIEDVHAPLNSEGQHVRWEEMLPSPDAGPEASYARSILLEELEAALDELPEAQREAFLAHEIEGRSFKDLVAETGISVSSLLSRKHNAVIYLRKRLQEIHEEFTKL